MNADVRYAVTLVNIVLLHWNAKYHNILPTLDSISHDNAFISYHPYEFYQRTLLALFQLNNTNPIEMHFIEKPVYAAIGMLGNLGAFAGDLNNNSENGTMALWTVSHPNESLFLCGIVVAESKLTNDQWKVIDVSVSMNVTDYKYVDTEKYVSLIEYLEGNVTDPVSLWKSFGMPSYPNAAERQIMRKSQGPHILKTASIHRNNSHLSLHFNAIIQQPWIISIRICGERLPEPSQPKNLRIRRVNDNEVVLFWKEKFTKSRCTKTFEIFFSPENWNKKWINLTAKQHVPFFSYHFAPDVNKSITVRGRYKVRGVDVFDRKGKFSSIKIF
ncbi:hypothetical protein HA402_013694 [Bradysia odoriphaga]|nr:hypothetical protein HA402_013694 [Bradysia odoriphaga]